MLQQPPYKPLIALILFLCLCLSINGQDIPFKRIPNQLGLSQNLITCLFQDKQGFLWVGTKDGLNRFDGYSFQVFRSNAFDTTSLSGNYIQDILEDQKGQLWVATTKGVNILNRKSERFTRILAGANGLSHAETTGIVEDQEGNIWVMTSGGGINQISPAYPANGSPHFDIKHFLPTSATDTSWPSSAMRIMIDRDNNIWSYGTDGIRRIFKDSKTGAYRAVHFTINQLNLNTNLFQLENLQLNDSGTDKRQIFAIFLDESRQLLATTPIGLARWDNTAQQFRFQTIDLRRDSVGDFPMEGTIFGVGLESQKQQYWLSGYLALTILDAKTGQLMDRFSNKSGRLGGLANANALALLEDRAGIIWLGTNGNGLFKYVPHIQRFNQGEGNKRWTGRSFRSICQTKDGTVWAGTTQAQLFQWDMSQNEMVPVILNTSWERDSPDRFSVIYTMLEDRKGRLWLGGPKGLFVFYHKNGKIQEWKHFPIAQTNASALNRNGVRDLYEDAEGKIWLISLESFGWFDSETEEFHGESYLPYVEGAGSPGHYPCIFQQSDGTFWLGTDNGLLKYRAETKTFTAFRSDANNPESLSNNVIKCIAADHREPERYLWIGTGGGGLNRFDAQAETFEHFTIEDGLPDQVIYSVLDSEDGHLWLSTNSGLSRFNPEDRTFRNYTSTDGLQDNEFNTSAYFKSNTGQLFFGGINGVNAFYPSTLADNSFSPPIVLTDFKISNKSVDFQATDSPLKQPISEVESITLSYKDKVFSFEFAALDFTDPSRNQYAYMLEGFDKNWQFIGNSRTATFTNIDPGRYTFRVKGSNNDGIWNEEGTSIQLIILPPWWQTWWAYTLFGIALLAGVTVFYRFNLNRQLAQREAQRLREMDELKSQLYTNITHEFRTPLTVIKGMAEQVPQVWELPNVMEIIRRNSDNLLRMVNQLLDLAKLESGGLRLNLKQADMIAYLRYLTESFHTMAEDRKIKLRFIADELELMMDFDEGKVQQIVYNLISNALKFTPEGGAVKVKVSSKAIGGIPGLGKEKMLQLSVKDSGIGIAPDKLPYIFDRFYQVDASSTRKAEGTGIGLTLTKELVELMGGLITVESKPEEGTEVLVLLPIRQEAAIADVYLPVSNHSKTLVAASKAAVTTALQTEDKEEHPLLLIIEDNRDVVAYIRRCVEKVYRVEAAENGRIGIEKAFELVPDIIISDVMMPEKDGYEVTETLKTDKRTSHIPIIILTAKATQEDKLTGLRTGADAYLMKPFNKEELLIRLANLVALRKQLQEKYRMGLPFSAAVAEQPSLEDEFLRTIQTTILDRLDDPELNVDDLAKAVFLSHTQMYRKLKALTGKTPTLFMRSIRLQKGRELLLTTNQSVTEVAFQVGFNDPNYFSRVFQKEFSVLPSEVTSG